MSKNNKPISADALGHEGQGIDLEKVDAGHARAFIAGPYLVPRKNRTAPPTSIDIRSPQARLSEAEGLALAIDLDIAGSLIIQVNEIRPATFIGGGKAEEIATLARSADADLIVMDCALSPVQQRNLEKIFGAKVIDRTGLILEIFGKRARTKEGRLQVELAHLSYQRSRLVRSWTHLERQRGGHGFMGGPGETQIEADRRLIQDRIIRLEKELTQVKRTRGLHRKNRAKVPFPVVALVGYTNAGKSTLFNTLTNAEILAKDMLFATLDPTMRAVSLPHGQKVMLSDTVGFISELPTMLVSAFQATLEEVLEAEVILHVRDISDPETAAQSADVNDVLRQLGIDTDQAGRIIEVWNKIDLLPDDEAAAKRNLASNRSSDERPIIVSALKGIGLDDLLAEIEQRVTGSRSVYDLRLSSDDGAGLAWLYENMEVVGRDDGEEGFLSLQIRVAPERLGRFNRKFPEAVLQDLRPQENLSDKIMLA